MTAKKNLPCEDCGDLTNLYYITKDSPGERHPLCYSCREKRVIDQMMFADNSQEG